MNSPLNTPCSAQWFLQFLAVPNGKPSQLGYPKPKPACKTVRPLLRKHQDESCERFICPKHHLKHAHLSSRIPEEALHKSYALSQHVIASYRITRLVASFHLLSTWHAADQFGPRSETNLCHIDSCNLQNLDLGSGRRNNSGYVRQFTSEVVGLGKISEESQRTWQSQPLGGGMNFSPARVGRLPAAATG